VAAGFSGARLWRGEDPGAVRVALKAWPSGTTPERLRQIHFWMSQAAHLDFVPRVLAGARDEMVCVEGGRAWDACSWMPGEARRDPTPSEVRTACEAVAALHGALSGSTTLGPCPGVLNRLRVLAENEPLLRAGPDSLAPVSPQLDPLLRRAVEAVARAAPRLRHQLQPWASRPFTLQPCARDLRGEHVLFESGRVRGIIDFGAAAVDHPAVDLARLLGDFAPHDEALFAAGLNAYARARGSFGVPEEFVRLLTRSGTICSLLGWLVRVVVRREPVCDVAGVTSRLAQLVARAEPPAAV
jgi:homoserine kinase type II